MEEYKGAENIYWAFSSSAQAVAAFIGFICAGFFSVMIAWIEKWIKMKPFLRSIPILRNNTLKN